MKTFRRVSLAGTIAVLSLSLGVTPAGAITNGSYDGNDHPNVGIVFIAGVPATSGFCSGSLLSATEFLTAGHCTALFTALGLPPEIVFVTFDEQLSLSPDFAISAAHPIAVTGWVTHPDFTVSSGGSLAAPSLTNDVGVIHLAEDVDVAAIELPDVGLLDVEAAQGGLLGHEFVNVGYGLNGLDRAFWGPQVNWTWEYRRMTTSSPFMALTRNHLMEHGGICGGDSGGPVFYGGADPNLVVATVAQADERCQSLGGNQRLDLQPVLDFLDDYR